MLRQYRPGGRFHYERVGSRRIPVGPIPIGTIFRIPAPLGRSSATTNSFIVEAWLPRKLGAARRVNGRYTCTFVAGGGHLALCRSLHDGSRRLVADHILIAASDAGCEAHS
jgi:hypothetical protein